MILPNFHVAWVVYIQHHKVGLVFFNSLPRGGKAKHDDGHQARRHSHLLEGSEHLAKRDATRDWDHEVEAEHACGGLLIRKDGMFRRACGGDIID